ncbi:MAG: DUF4143 domain-containing protein, partial [Armatimonadetes bacterium]|nr:DUF4143 domain-containing protein [Armatimonadota bacterium]
RIGDLAAFQKFLRLCAGRSAQLLNLSSLANDCGISHTTAKSWLSVLEASCLVFLLQPHHENFSKRLIKSPKLYFLDSGLMCYLLRIRDEDHLLTHPLRGEVFETFVVSEIVKSFVHAGEEPPLYFWRDHTGHEVDVILDLGTKLIPVEIKSGKTFRASFLDGLKFYTSIAGKTASGGVLVYGGDQAYEREGFRVKPWWQCS